MRLATAAQMAAIDRDTIASGVPALELMERAGREMLHALMDALPMLEPPAPIALCCGKGNNGGDGLVLARLLDQLGFEVSVLLLAPPDDLSADAAMNCSRLPETVEVIIPMREDWVDIWLRLQADCDVVIDAVFGTGVRPPIQGEYVDLFHAFDRRLATVVSLDVPSGVSGDDGHVDPVAVQADHTITVGLPKLGLFVPPGRDHTGAVSVVDIGFPDEICERHTDDHHILWPVDVAELLPVRPGDTHKYQSGTCLVLAGSQRFGGAALLAGLGALRSGAGLVTLGLPSCHVSAALGQVTEALVTGLETDASGCLCPMEKTAFDDLITRQTAWTVGPGLGAAPETDAFIIETLARVSLPVVVDADGLSAFVRSETKPCFASSEVVLTPHHGELARLAGITNEELTARRFEIVPELAQRWGVTLVAKGAPTLVADASGTVYVNGTGHDALAHGGTGDVLAGLIGGLLAQGLNGIDAAALGCWLHGRAGEIVAELAGTRRGVLARDVAGEIPSAFAELEWYLDGGGPA